MRRCPGKVAEANEQIPDSPDILKKDAYNAGWLIKIQATDAAQFDSLMDCGCLSKIP